jgi:hypothetical protein
MNTLDDSVSAGVKYEDISSSNNNDNSARQRNIRRVSKQAPPKAPEKQEPEPIVEDRSNSDHVGNQNQDTQPHQRDEETIRREERELVESLMKFKSYDELRRWDRQRIAEHMRMGMDGGRGMNPGEPHRMDSEIPKQNEHFNPSDHRAEQNPERHGEPENPHKSGEHAEPKAETQKTEHSSTNNHHENPASSKAPEENSKSNSAEGQHTQANSKSESPQELHDRLEKLQKEMEALRESLRKPAV